MINKIEEMNQFSCIEIAERSLDLNTHLSYHTMIHLRTPVNTLIVPHHDTSQDTCKHTLIVPHHDTSQDTCKHTLIVPHHDTSQDTGKSIHDSLSKFLTNIPF